jgi:hypothetical protein
VGATKIQREGVYFQNPVKFTLYIPVTLIMAEKKFKNFKA